MSFKLSNSLLIFVAFVTVVNSTSIFNKIPKLTFNQVPNELSSLVQVNVLFRHGNRTPSLNELYPKDPYLNFTYFPFGNGQLTNEGKRKEYSVGEALKKRYGHILGDYYYPDLVESRSTDYNRTKMSLDLVHASLFPPVGVEKWKNGLNWQPVPYNYQPTDNDKILLGMNCPTYTKLYNEYIKSPKFQSEISPYLEVFDYISQNTGLNVTSFQQVYDLYFGLSTEEEWGFTLPEWTKSVWPDTIVNLAIKQYYAETATKELASLVNGYLLRKIISDAQTKIAKMPEKLGRKLYLYSAHENNIGELLVALGIFNPPHIPTYGSYLIFELHNMKNTYGFKILYQHYVTPEPKILILPGCEEFCPLEKFISLCKDLIPTDDLCGK